MNKTKKTHGTTNAMLDFLNGGSKRQVAKENGYNPGRLSTNSTTIAVRNLPTGNTTHNEKSILFLHSSEEERMQDFQEHGNDAYDVFCETHCIPGELSYIKALGVIEKDKQAYIDFFEYLVSERKVNIPAFCRFAKQHANLFELVQAADMFHFVYRLGYVPFTRTFQSWLEVHYILRPALDENDDTHSMTRKCKQCQRFFIAKTAKTQFCSPSCRVKSYEKKII